MSSWNQVSTPPGMSGGEQLQYLASNGAGLWVVGSSAGNLWTSSNDGVSWAGPNAIPSDLSGINGIQFLGTDFFLYGPSTTAGTNIYTSTDGATWTERASGLNFIVANQGAGNGQPMAYSGSLFVLVGGGTGTPSDGSSATSPDGITWTLKSTYDPTNPNGFLAVCWDGAHFVAVTADSALTPNDQVATSTDGATWTFQGLNTIPGPNGVLEGVSFFASKYLVAQGYNAGSTTGWLEIASVLSPWNGAEVNLTTGLVPNAFMAQNGSTVAIGWCVDQSGNVFALTTTDGATFNTEAMTPFNGGFAECIARGADGFMAVGFNVSNTPAVLFRADGVMVPDVVGDTQAAATAAITGAGLTLGAVSNAYNSSVPAGVVFVQSPIAGAIVSSGSAVNITLSLGPQQVTVPDVEGLSAAAADGALLAVGLVSGVITGVTEPSVPVGDVATQDPVAGTLVSFGSAVNLGISFLVPEFDIDATVISQYANSPTIIELVEDFGQWFDPGVNFQQFYLMVWNLQTASGFGLDIWGIILGVSRVVPIPGTSGAFGFDNSDTPPDWETFGNLDIPTAGGPFFSGQLSSGSYRLNDGPYLTLLLTKALANICATTAPALNALISNLFPGRGRCYTIDRGHMEMAYFFEFQLTPIELAILEFSGVLAHPAGVGVSINIVPGGFFGFEEAGPLSEPFGSGVFYNG